MWWFFICYFFFFRLGVTNQSCSNQSRSEDLWSPVGLDSSQFYLLIFALWRVYLQLKSFYIIILTKYQEILPKYNTPFVSIQYGVGYTWIFYFKIRSPFFSRP